MNLSLKKLLTLEIPIPLRPVQDEVIGLRKIWSEQKKRLRI